jgi:hypothetical protein
MSHQQVQVFGPKRHAFMCVAGVLNEGEKFRAQLARMQPLAAVADVMVADGGSTDGATDPELLRASGVRTLLVLEGGKGLSDQYRAAFAYCLEQGYDGVIMVDGNGKDGVEAVMTFMARLREGYDFVQGSRFLRGGYHANTPLDRLIAIRCIFTPIMRIASGFRYTDAINGFKAVSARLLRDERMGALRDVFEGYTLQYYLNLRAPKLGFRVCEVPVRRIYPTSGPVPSKIGGLKGRARILWQLAKVLCGVYHPR